MIVATGGGNGVAAPITSTSSAATSSAAELSGLRSTAAPRNFTTGSLTVDGGVYAPAQQTVTQSTSPTTNVTFSNSFAISGGADTSDRAAVSLINGATFTLAGDTTTSNALFVGLNGGRGDLSVAGSGSRVATPPSGAMFVGSGGSGGSGGDAGAGAAFAGGDGTLTLGGGGQAIASGTVAVGAFGGVGTTTVDGVNSRLAANGGTLSVGLSRYSADAGQQGNGTLAIINAGQAGSLGDTRVGYAGGVGSVSVNGLGSKLSSVNGTLAVGRDRFTASGPLGDGTLSLTENAQASFKNVILGDNGGRGFAVVESDAKLIAASGDLSVGVSRTGTAAGLQGEGTLSLIGGGQASSFNNAFVGDSGGVGLVTVDGRGTGGTASALSIGAGLYVGSFTYFDITPSSGQITVSRGGSLASGTRTGDAAYVGYFGGIGGISLGSTNATASTWTHTGDANFGSDGSHLGTGTLDIGAGGVATLSGTLHVYGAASTVAGKSGGTINLNGGTLKVGALNTHGAPDRLNFTAGTLQVTNGGLTVGPGGTVLSQTLPATKSLIVSGATDLLPGGTISLTGGTLSTGSLGSGVSSGNFTFTGGSLALTSSGLTIGAAGPLGSSPTLSAGKSLAVALVTSIDSGATLVVGGGAFTTGSLANAGGLTVTNSTASVAGASTNAAGGQITVTGGTLNLGAGVANRLTSSGTVNLSNATVNGDLDSPAGSQISLAGNSTFNGQLSGSPTITGTGKATVGTTGRLSPGVGGAGTMTFPGDVSIFGTMQMKLVSSTANGKIVVGGNAFLNGVVDVDLATGFTPAAGDRFDVLDVAGLFSGSGYAFDFADASLPSGLGWKTSDFGSSGEISIVATPEPGTTLLAMIAGQTLLGLRRRRRR